MRPARLVLLLLLAGSLLALPGSARAQQPPADPAGREEDLLAELAARGRAGGAAYEAGDFARGRAEFAAAAEVGRHLVALGSRRIDPIQAVGLSYYNAACCAARAGDTDDALRLLDASLAAGFDDLPLVERDADLGPLRADAAGYERVVGPLRRRVASFAEGYAEGRIIVPPDVAPDAPLGCIVALHGAGGNVEEFAPFWERASRRLGVVVVLVRGPIAYGRGVFRWRQEQPAEDTALIEAWLARAAERHPGIDPARAVLAGFSQGGGQALLLGLDGPRAWAGVLAIGPYVQVAQRRRLATTSPRSARFALVVGELEEDAILAGARGFAARDGDAGLAVRLQEVPALGHALAPRVLDEVERAWRWLEVAPAAATP